MLKPVTMWDKRYATEEYVYGTEPNGFLVEQAHRLQGPVLSIAEGEGRNAVFLATRGLTVHGVDASAVGLRKAQALAQTKGVTIQTEVADLAAFDPLPDHYGAVIAIFAHVPSTLRRRLCPRLEQCLQPGGLVVLEAYGEAQFHYGTGGPKDLDLLMSCAKVAQEFPSLEPLLLQERERDVIEGSYHTGRAAVIQFVGRKPL